MNQEEPKSSYLDSSQILSRDTGTLVVALFDIIDSTQSKQDTTLLSWATPIVTNIDKILQISESFPDVSYIKASGDGLLFGSFFNNSTDTQGDLTKAVIQYYRFACEVKDVFRREVDSRFTSSFKSVLGLCSNTLHYSIPLKAPDLPPVSDYLSYDLDLCFRIEKYGVWEGIVLNELFSEQLFQNEIDVGDRAVKLKRLVKGSNDPVEFIFLWDKECPIFKNPKDPASKSRFEESDVLRDAMLKNYLKNNGG